MFRYLYLNCRTPRGLLFFHIFQANKAWSTCARRHNTWWDKAWENTTRPHSLPVLFQPQTHPQNDPNQSKHLNNVYYSQKELSQEIASDTKQSRLLSLSQESSTSSKDSNFTEFGQPLMGSSRPRECLTQSYPIKLLIIKPTTLLTAIMYIYCFLN